IRQYACTCQSVFAHVSPSVLRKSSRSTSSPKIGSRRSPRFITWYIAPSYSTLSFRAMPAMLFPSDHLSILRTDPFYLSILRTDPFSLVNTENRPFFFFDPFFFRPLFFFFPRRPACRHERGFQHQPLLSPAAALAVNLLGSPAGVHLNFLRATG